MPRARCDSNEWSRDRLIRSLHSRSADEFDPEWWTRSAIASEVAMLRELRYDGKQAAADRHEIRRCDERPLREHHINMVGAGGLRKLDAHDAIAETACNVKHFARGSGLERRMQRACANHRLRNRELMCLVSRSVNLP